MSDGRGGIDLYWLPLGAGGHSVRLNGRLYEAASSRRHHRVARDLYHSALVVHSRSGPVVIEVTPVGRGDGAMRGVVASGPVGSRLLRHLRLFRYEVRRWPNGVIPDVAEAVESPARLTDDPTVSERTLRLAPDVPMLVWGRDESRTGDMWNSNSVISWLLTRSSLPAASIRPPANGRAPGWHAGVVVAHRSAAS